MLKEIKQILKISKVGCECDVLTSGLVDKVVFPMDDSCVKAKKH